jgi:hypothetical protein
MNLLRIWGGGIYLPAAFYDAADRAGVLVYHDQMFTTTTTSHEPCGSAEEEGELRQNVRALAHHPSIAVWNACNECSGKGLYVSFVMTITADEDDSRPIWPSCPSSGWAAGVHKLDARPNGNPLQSGGPGHIEKHGPYLNGAGWQAVNFVTKRKIGSNLPIELSPTNSSGVQLPSVFGSEFGASVMSSFESMAPTLDPAHWSLHGGAPEDNCSAHDVTTAFWHECVGGNVMAERNYPCDDQVSVYFGDAAHVT